MRISHHSTSRLAVRYSVLERSGQRTALSRLHSLQQSSCTCSPSHLPAAAARRGGAIRGPLADTGSGTVAPRVASDESRGTRELHTV